MEAMVLASNMKKFDRDEREEIPGKYLSKNEKSQKMPV